MKEIANYFPGLQLYDGNPYVSGNTFEDFYDDEYKIAGGIGFRQSYEIKSPPWTILWFRILGIFSVENIDRLCVFIFQT